MIKHIYMIIGASGTGKDTVMKRLINDLPFLNMWRESTNRPMRHGESQGNPYNFITNFAWINGYINVDPRFYTMIINGKDTNVQYGHLIDMNKLNDPNNEVNYLVQSTLEGLNMFYDFEDGVLRDKIIPIYLYVDDEYVLLRRAIERENITYPKGANWKEKSSELDEIHRRIKQDKIDFSEENINNSPIPLHKINSNREIGIVVTDIKHIIFDSLDRSEIIKATYSIIENKLKGSMKELEEFIR